jgi:hypothetical protein
MKPLAELRDRLRRIQLLLLVAALVAIAIGAYGFLQAPEFFFPAYLVGFLLCLGIPLGSWALMCIHNLTGGDWGIAVRPVLRAAVLTLPAVGLLFIPILFGMPVLYEWSNASHAGHDAILQAKSDYLNVPFFQLRAAIYFAIWIVLGMVGVAWTARRDRAGDDGSESRGLQLFSGPSLLLYGLTITFASVDWAMSIEPHWFSATYGVLFMGAEAVAALSVAILVTIGLAPYYPFSRLVSRERLHDLGNLLLAMVMFWSYIAFMQYLIIWSANLPEETPYYIHRNQGGWEIIPPLLMAFHFAVPFLLLLLRKTKRSASRMAGVTILLLVMRLIDLHWLILPRFVPALSALHWLHIVMPLGVVAVWLCVFVWRLTSAASWEDRYAAEVTA